MGVGIFSDCVFFLCVNSLPYKKKTNLKNSITANGGAISFVVNEKCTHVVVLGDTTLKSSQLKKIQKYSISIVKPDFIWRSIQEKQLVEVDLADNNALEVNPDQVKDDKKSQFLAKFMKHINEDIAERDSIDDEEFEEGVDEKDLQYDTEVAKYSFFQKGEEVAVVELLCFSEKSPFPFKVSTVSCVPGTSQKETTFNLVNTSEKACDKYEQRMKDLKNKGFTQINKIRPEVEVLASKALQKMLLGEALNVTDLSLEVASFVESVWTESQGHLMSSLSCPVGNISLNDVSKAEGILQNLHSAQNKGEDGQELMQEFYQCIPHRRRQSKCDKKFLTAKQELCQLIRDMVNINETNSSSSTGKYRALKCRIEYVDPNTEEFHQVKKLVLDNNHSNEEYEILRVFHVGRLSEAINFKSDLENVQPLLHASSPCNIVGILSRGLLLPKIIVDDGLERTDDGNLGSGIYFGDSISTSVKYAKAFRFGGQKILLVCEVALGNTKDVYDRDNSITQPPDGFHSIHAVRKDVCKDSYFDDDEYVVYNLNQVKIKYVVEFCNSKDALGMSAKPAVSIIEENEEMDTCEPSEDDPVEELPEEKVQKGGLLGMDGQQIPLENIHVKARLKDMAAQVIIFQTYKNNSEFPIEAKYVFPLDNTAAVCGFEAFINGKHIVGEVKEKQQAHREYRAAISQGHGAYLMDQDAPDVFTVSVGNLPAKATVIIKITYVTELSFSYSSMTFSIPGTVASWQEDKALKENTQDTVAKVGIEGEQAAQGKFCLDMSIEMPRKMEYVSCYTHTIKIKQTECKAVVQVEEGSSLTEDGFSIHISIEDAYIPRMWIETHEEKDSEACMLIFHPEFDETLEESKITICLDCSNSMESCFQSAKRVALLALKTLSSEPINVITFGSTYKEFYLYPKKTDDLSEMEKFIKMAKPNMGSTEFWKPLLSTSLLKPSSGHQKFLLISDGHLQNDNIVFQFLKKTQNQIKVFTCGVGTKANKHMLRCLARNSAGAFEYFEDKTKSSWNRQMEKQNERMRMTACTAVSIKWRLFGNNPPQPLQAPASIHSLYYNDTLFVYGFVPHCTQATLKALINQKEFENIVSTTELQKTTGTILHKLTARALIQDYEDGILREKEHENEMEKQKMKSFIIDLSKEHSIVTQFTSFVAIEKRSAEEGENVEPNIAEIISAEDVDILPYMTYEEDKDNEMSKTAGSSGSLGSCDDYDVEEDDSMLDCTFSAFGSSNLQTVPEPQLSPMAASGQMPLYLGRSLDHGLFGSRPLAEIERAYGLPPPVFGMEAGAPSRILHRMESPTSALMGCSLSLLGAPNLQTVPEPQLSPMAASGQMPPYLERPVDHGLFRSRSFAEVERAYGHPHPLFGMGAGAPSSQWMAMNSLMGAGSSQEEPQSLPLLCGSRVRRAARKESSGFSGSFGTPSSLLHGSSFTGSQKMDLQAPPEDIPSCFSARSILPESEAEFGSRKAFLSGRPKARAHDSQKMDIQAPSEDIPSDLRVQAAKIRYKSLEQSAVLFGRSEARPRVTSLMNESAPFVPMAPVVPSEDKSASHKTFFLDSISPSEATPIQPSLPPPPPPCISKKSVSLAPMQREFLLQPSRQSRKSIKRLVGLALQDMEHERSQLSDLSWSSFALLQSQEGYWMLTPDLGRLLNINMEYFCDHFLAKKGISSLGLRGKEEVLKLIATLLVLQTIRTFNLLRGITFKTLMKLDECDTTSESYENIKKAVKWAVQIDCQYAGISSRLDLGRDWEHATRQLLGLEPTTNDLSFALYK